MPTDEIDAEMTAILQQMIVTRIKMRAAQREHENHAPTMIQKVNEAGQELCEFFNEKQVKMDSLIFVFSCVAVHLDTDYLSTMPQIKDKHKGVDTLAHLYEMVKMAHGHLRKGVSEKMQREILQELTGSIWSSNPSIEDLYLALVLVVNNLDLTVLEKALLSHLRNSAIV